MEETIKKLLIKIQNKARRSGHLDDMEQICWKCGEIVMGFDDEKHPCNNYYCDCGNSWCDTEEWMNTRVDHADNLRKAAKEGI